MENQLPRYPLPSRYEFSSRQTRMATNPAVGQDVTGDYQQAVEPSFGAPPYQRYQPITQPGDPRLSQTPPQRGIPRMTSAGNVYDDVTSQGTTTYQPLPYPQDPYPYYTPAVDTSVTGTYTPQSGTPSPPQGISMPNQSVGYGAPTATQTPPSPTEGYFLVTDSTGQQYYAKYRLTRNAFGQEYWMPVPP